MLNQSAPNPYGGCAGSDRFNGNENKLKSPGAPNGGKVERHGLRKPDPWPLGPWAGRAVIVFSPINLVAVSYLDICGDAPAS